MPDKTTLLLGAGASCSYGFPVGDQLRRNLLEFEEGSAESLGQTARAFRDFRHAFGRSQEYSIDAFLSRRADFREIGKAAIAKIIIGAEMNTDVFDEKNEDNWCRYVLGQIANCSWDEFDPSWLSIVTFNYDRSLEFLLGQALQHRYGKSQAEVLERLDALQIAHVYGSLGSPRTGRADYLRYKTRTDEEQRYAEEHWIHHAAARIRVIPEGRDDDPMLEVARELLRGADRICVLGFGFDEVNMRRIGAPEVFRSGETQRPRSRLR